MTQPVTPLHSASTIHDILHALVSLGIVAASIFVKNPNSQQHAVSIINLVNGTVLPIADSLINTPATTLSPLTPDSTGA